MIDVNEIRKDFPMLNNNIENQGHKLVYFDNAATTFKPYPVIKECFRYYEYENANSHRGDYDLAFKVDQNVDKVREKVANFINAKKEEIVFTSGTSMSINLIAFGYGVKHLKEDDEILLTEAEHASNVLPWFKVKEMTNCKINYIPLDESGRLTIENLKKVINKHTKITDELVNSIVSELQRDKLSEEQIGELLNISPYTVGQINRGKHSICKSMNISFPIRQKQHRNKTNYSGRKINDNQLLEIIDLLLNTSLSTEEIARRYNVDKSAIDRINRGVVFKPITNQYKLPIRQNKQDNLQRVVA